MTIGGKLMSSWPDVALTAVLLAAIVALHVFVPDDPSARTTVLALLAVASPWLASFRRQRQAPETKDGTDQVR